MDALFDGSKETPVLNCVVNCRGAAATTWASGVEQDTTNFARLVTFEQPLEDRRCRLEHR